MGSRDRESEFPATSIGRTSATRLQHSSSDSHPLGLSEPKYRPYTPRQRAVAPTVSTTGTLVYPPSPGHHSNNSTGAASGSTTTDATTKLQLTNAKAVAQNVGLDTTRGGSVGWAILEKVVAESETGELWAEIWSAIITGKATLLLPAEQISSHDKLTPEFLKDHIALYDDSTRKDVPVSVITLSGLRGTLHRNQITFYSTIHPSSKLFHDLLDPQTRSSALRKLPPLPHTRTPPPSSSLSSSAPPSPSPSSSSYPSIKVKSGSTETLPLPPRAPTTSKPPLPPRPGSLRSSTAPASNVPAASVLSPAAIPSSSSSSRIPNPFASLFGHRPSTPTPSPSTIPPPPPAAVIPPVIAATASNNSPSTSSIRSLDSLNTTNTTTTATTTIGPDSHHTTTIEISALIIDKKIGRKEIGKQMNKGVKRDIRGALAATGGGRDEHSGEKQEVVLPTWVIERIVDICEESWFPFVRAPKVITSKTTTTTSGSGSTTTAQRRGATATTATAHGEEWVVNHTEETPDDIADWLQEFYTLLEQDLRIELAGRHGHGHSHHSGSSASNTTTTAEKEGGEEGGSTDGSVDVVEVRIYEIMERVERVICEAFYDRLFMQPSTDDASHDEALANRVAALNILDLTLEHLDIQVGSGGRKEVDGVVKACGAKLCELDMNHAPKDKARILVDAHQLVVDGLSRLPPIRLMSPEESKALREQSQAQRPTREGVDSQAPLPAVSIPATTTEPTLVVSTTEPDSSQKLQQQQVELSPLSLAETAPLPSSPRIITTTTTQQPTPVSSDVLLPMIIFSVAKANPPRLVSNLRFTQRFRKIPHCCSLSSTHAQPQGGGEEAFCLINVLAVAEFLENVDLEGLGLSTAAISPTDLTPIIPRTTPPTPPITPTPTTTTMSTQRQLTPKSTSSIPPPLLAGIDTFPGTAATLGLRGKAEQQVDAIAGSANKVISGVVDSSFGILKSLLPINQNHTQQQQQGVMIMGGAPGVSSQDVVVPFDGSGLVQTKKRETGFSTLASLAASLPIARGGGGKGELLEDEAGQQLVTVSSRPGSIRSTEKASSLRGVADSDEEEEESGSEDESDESSEDEDEDDDNEEGLEDDDDDDGEEESGSEEGDQEEERRTGGVDIPGISIAKGGATTSSTTSFTADARSIRSFESMLRESKKRDRERKQRSKKNIKAKVKAALAGKNTGEQKNKSVSVTRALSEPRKSLSDRLASVSSLAGGLKGSPPDSRRSSLLQPPITATPLPIPSTRPDSIRMRRSGSPASSRPPSPSPSPSRPSSPLPVARVPSPSPSARGNRLPAPNQRFMECNVEELRISEVAELLTEYRSLVEAVKNLGGF